MQNIRLVFEYIENLSFSLTPVILCRHRKLAYAVQEAAETYAHSRLLVAVNWNLFVPQLKHTLIFAMH